MALCFDNYVVNGVLLTKVSLILKLSEELPEDIWPVFQLVLHFQNTTAARFWRAVYNSGVQINQATRNDKLYIQQLWFLESSQVIWGKETNEALKECEKLVFYDHRFWPWLCKILRFQHGNYHAYDAFSVWFSLNHTHAFSQSNILY